MKKSVYSAMAIPAFVSLLAYTNCSEFTPVGAQSSTLNGSATGASSSSTSIPTGSNNSGESSTASSAQLKVYVASSLSGPWVENGVACRGQDSYFKVTGVNLSNPVKGCASLFSDDGCLNLKNHRSYLPSELSTGDIITSITAADSYSFPIAKYAFYLTFFPDQDTHLLKKVGSAEMKECGSPSVPPPSCAWREPIPTAVIGGGSMVYPSTPCTQDTQGQSGSGYYDMGSGNSSPKVFQCYCQ